MSTTEKSNCSISSFLPMSCRERAQEFARNLHSRLSSLDLDANGDGCQVNENSWLGTRETSIAVSNQPRQSSDGYNGFYEIPQSPEEEIPVLSLVNNGDCVAPTKFENLNGFKTLNKECTSHRYDSDSSNEQYFNTKSELKQNGIDSNVNSIDEDELHTSRINNHTEDDHSTRSSEMIYERQDTLELVPEHNAEIKINTCDNLVNIEVQEETEAITYKTEVTTIIPQINYIENEEVHLSKTESPKRKEKETPKLKQNYLDVTLTSVEDYEDEIENEPVSPRVRRCSSLKTGKTPPGTPRKKKIVHFADVLGLELTNVRSFLDEIPKIPNSAFDDLVNVEPVIPAFVPQPIFTCQAYTPERILCSMFQQPGDQPNYYEMLTEKNACLENAVVDDPIDLSIRGTVRVRNLDFHKSVFIRYSLDGWKTHADLQASYVKNSCDGFSDKFSFLLYAHTLRIGQTLEFAVRFHCKGTQYWDNNYGANYCFQCLPASKHVDHLAIDNFGDNWDPKFYYNDNNANPNLPIDLQTNLPVETNANEDVDLIDENLISNHQNSNYVNSFRCKQQWKYNIIAIQDRRSDILIVVVILLFSIFYMYVF